MCEISAILKDRNQQALDLSCPGIPFSEYFQNDLNDEYPSCYISIFRNKKLKIREEKAVTPLCHRDGGKEDLNNFKEIFKKIGLDFDELSSYFCYKSCSERTILLLQETKKYKSFFHSWHKSGCPNTFNSFSIPKGLNIYVVESFYDFLLKK